MSDQPRYSRADLDDLQSKSRSEILEIFGSFEDRGMDDSDFLSQAVQLLSPERVPGLDDAISPNDPGAIGDAVLSVCSRPAAEESEPSAAIIEEADRVLGNVFTFYGESHQLPDDIDWDYNPGTRHWGMDLNRFTYLRPLTLAHLATKDDRYGRKAIDLILDWVAKCEIERCFAGTPYVFGSYLNNTIHISAWARCLVALIPAGIVQPIELLRILKSVHEQIGYLEVVTNGHKGNWPTIGCQGVLATLAALPVLRDQDRFTDYFIETLDTQLQEQILPDGVQDELTPHYHSVVINNILTCAASCQDLGLSLKATTLDTLRNMLHYQAQAITPNRTARVAFNDSDPEALGDITPTLERLGFPDYWPAPGKLGPQAFPYAGVAFLRQRQTDGDLYLAFDGGPFGRSHQHEDKLGFWLHAYGRDLIVDPGRHLYDQTEVSYLPYLRTTHAHSTITVDDQGQNSRAHKDTWIAKAPGSLKYVEENGAIRASARYDLGYGDDNAIDVVHHREIVFVEERFWILFDRIAGDGRHTISSRFHFYPGDVIADGNRAHSQNNDGNLLLEATGDWDAVQIHKGEQDPRMGWYSASYNKIEPSPTLSFTADSALPLSYAVLLLPYRGTEPPSATVSFANGTATVSVDGSDYSVTSTLT